MNATTARLTFLRHAGFDLSPDPENIRHLLDSGWTQAEVAEVYHVSIRTIQRWLSDPVMTPGGRICHYHRRTP
jgi:DNA-binding NarL/FixJ family response regulator